MATAAVAYPSNLYHQHTFFNSALSSKHRIPYIYGANYKPKSHRQRHEPQTSAPKTTTTTKTTKNTDSNIQQLPSRRSPRIHRQVIVLPTPEPIYRQVRHRLPTPERDVVQRTIIQKANGDVIVQHERHRKKTKKRSSSSDSK